MRIKTIMIAAILLIGVKSFSQSKSKDFHGAVAEAKSYKAVYVMMTAVPEK